MVSTRIKPCKVLIVDNEPFVVEELIDLFENNDINCIGCVSSTEALTRFHDDEHVGVVLSDYRMPEMNGIELIHQLKKTAGKRPFESILFTGDADKEDVIAALRAGVSDYHQKPLDLDALLAGVQRLQRRVQRRAAAVGVELIGERIRQMAESLQELQQGVSGLTAEAETESVPVVELPGYSKLSPRQMEVAELLARGLTNYQISCELGISENTVKLYVSQVLRATNMHNRTMLALALGARK
ncbi:DNA-binding response regulator, NarL/FixJ family, contains REC and HTH domains [Halopseudomonas formosensis]|uniref:DNA-binding response regulator, NarL/FixJ family, contains REC and HTH domains n=1 Tax=Halopseudomonas formosensis TaxID=1002526 RepID=A0A1I6C2L4_9GAMM|nr:response regulator transcription factor [Halopseudomonas formosensis]SFQ87436.1 DNA-binding response regulator, NarL/FixJ family, contains REC and HTH domains [Halopseudomonas formosensis]